MKARGSSQALALQQLTGNTPSLLRSQYVTPATVGVPHYTEKKALSLHKPHLLSVVDNADALSGSPRAQARAEMRVLDGFLLLEASGMGFPDDARVITLTDKRLEQVVEEDLQYFTGLVYLDLSENVLELQPFGNLPRLKELRLCYNSISHIGFLDGFLKLQVLDLSYNQLTLESVQELNALPALRELNLSGNSLKGLPPYMHLFKTLEKIIVESNEISDSGVFHILSTIPMLREVSLSYNFLGSVPPASCSNGLFRFLEVLDISFNYVATEDMLRPLIELPRLETIFLYGNPILGPTGEDPLKLYIEDLVDSALSAREGFTSAHLDIITEIPRRRRPLRKGEVMGRQATYQGFSIKKIPETLGGEKIKRSSDWKEIGNKSLFAEAVALARKQNAKEVDNGFNTFLTTGPANIDDDNVADNIADKVMAKVASTMGMTDTDIQVLQSKTYGSYGQQSRSEGAEITESLPSLFVPNERVPVNLFTRTLADAQTLSTHNIAMSTAIKALQYAVKNPLTNYSEVPAKGFLPPHDYVRPTQASTIRQRPRCHQLESGGKSPPKQRFGNEYSDSFKRGRRKARENTLAQIEEVLDSLNSNTDNIVDRSNIGKMSLVSMKTFSKPQTGLNYLVDMVNEVVTELQL